MDAIIASATSAIDRYKAAGREYAALVQREQKLEAGRAEAKQDAIGRLMKGFQLNGSPHSATSAEKGAAP